MIVFCREVPGAPVRPAPGFTVPTGVCSVLMTSEPNPVVLLLVKQSFYKLVFNVVMKRSKVGVIGIFLTNSLRFCPDNIVRVEEITKAP